MNTSLSDLASRHHFDLAEVICINDSDSEYRPMFATLKKMLGTQTTDHHGRTEAFLFSGSAYFSNRVPKAFTEEWVAHGGEISSGTILDVRARYFFATDPSDPWVTKLFSKSVMVIHAGWIAHCVSEAFQVPIAEYILDDSFIPGPPYKLTTNAHEIYAPLSVPARPIDTESGSHGPMLIHTSDTPSTPTSMPRKRKREQAYFDSPSGSLVFSGFDKDGLPRRPRKLRKLRFDPSFSPEGGRHNREAMCVTGLDRLRDNHDASRNSDNFSEEHDQHDGPCVLRGLSHMVTLRVPDTPETPLTNEALMAPYRNFSVRDDLPNPTHVSSPAISIGVQEKIPPVCMADFVNLTPPTRARRFPEIAASKSGDTGMMLSTTKLTDHKVKTPKKISFADHAQICVYAVSPQRQDSKDSTVAGPTRQCLGEDDEDRLEVNRKTRLSNKIEGCVESTAEAMKDLVVTQNYSLKMNDSFAGSLDGDQSENDTLKLTIEKVQEMRHRLLESAATNDADNGQLATLFELGKTFRGIVFRHIW